MYIKIISIILYTLLLSSCTFAQKPTMSPEEKALREEIGQMLLVGFRGTELSDTSHIVRDIRDYNIGAYAHSCRQ